MTVEEWNALPHWRRCEVLHALGMSWKEIASACGITVAALKKSVNARVERDPALELLDRFPLPRDRSEYRPRVEWLPYASCLSADTDWFVPKVGKPIDPRARQCCSECVVTQECLDEVLHVVDDFTYRAFTTPRIRRGYRKFFGIETETETEEFDDVDAGGDD